MSYAYTTATLLIEDGETQSTNSVDLMGYIVVGVATDAAFDGTGLTFDVASAYDGTFIGGASGEEITVGAGEYAGVAASPGRFIKVTSDAAQSGADSTVTLHLRSN